MSSSLCLGIIGRLLKKDPHLTTTCDPIESYTGLIFEEDVQSILYAVTRIQSKQCLYSLEQNKSC